MFYKHKRIYCKKFQAKKNLTQWGINPTNLALADPCTNHSAILTSDLMEVFQLYKSNTREYSTLKTTRKKICTCQQGGGGATGAIFPGPHLARGPR